MTGPEAVNLIDRLGLSKARFARLVDLHPNAISKWANGSKPHGPAVTLLRLLEDRPELIHVLESWVVKKRKARKTNSSANDKIAPQ